MSRQGQVAADRNLLECLSEKGSYKLVIFRNVIEPDLTFDSRAALLQAIGAAKDAYAEYLVQCEAHGKAPAFYLDCAGWFFKAKEMKLAIRILSNLSEMKLEDAALSRTLAQLVASGQLACRKNVFRLLK